MTDEPKAVVVSKLDKPAPKMNERQRKFLEVYLSNGRDATDAFKRVYDPKPGNTPLYYRVKASEKLKGAAVQAALAEVDQRVAMRTEKVLERYAITQERIAQELARIAFADVRETVEWDADGVRVKPSADLSDDVAASIAEVSEMKGPNGSTTKIRNYDKQRALIDLGKSLGMFKEQVDHRHLVSAKLIIEK